MSWVTLASCATRVLVMKNASTNIGFEMVISCSPPLYLPWAADLYGLICGLTEPVFETHLAESRVIAGNQCARAQLQAVIPRVRVRDHLARILACSQAASNEFIKTKLFRTSDFNGAVHWWV